MDNDNNKGAIRNWKVNTKKELFKNRFISIDQADCEREGDHKKSIFYKLQFPRWVNIIPVTKSGEIILIKQFRHGVESVTLEIPGGIVEKDETPLKGAMRELSEETGYSSDNWVSLGAVHPNPAIQGNICHIFLALDATLNSSTNFDEDEEIIILKTPINKLQELLNSGEITNAMVLASFALAITKDLLPNFKNKKLNLC